MKKIISSTLFLFAGLILSVGLFSKEAEAQNVGSLKDVVTSSFSFNKDLQLGDIDPDVKELQKVLNADPDTVIAPYDVGSKGQENTSFGSLTKAAVIKFQNKYSDVILTPAGLTVGNGFVGKLTRTRLNLLIGVINTYDSVGLPQNRVGSVATTTVTYVPPTVVVPSQPQMSTCQFVDLLINIGAIAPDKASLARSATNCSQMSTCQFVGLLINIGAIAPNKVDIARSATNCSIADTNNSNYNYVYNTSSGTNNNSSSNNYTVTSSQNNTTSSQLNITCAATPYVSALGQATKWTAVAAGGTGNYTYSWSGDENLNSNSQTFSKTYSSGGYKNAVVQVTSGSVVRTANCQAFIGQLTSTSNSNQGSGSSVSFDGSSISYGGTTINTGSGSSGSSPSFTGTPFAGEVTSVVKCITSYYPYREDTSIRQVVINPCSGSTGQSTGYLIIPAAQVPNVSQTVLGRYMPYVADCINPPGTMLGKPTDMRVGDSCIHSL